MQRDRCIGKLQCAQRLTNADKPVGQLLYNTSFVVSSVHSARYLLPHQAVIGGIDSEQKR